jgi:ectoine hydroxylase-related dioxygenase (phytanoyl-CoA dioxygenase family)
MWASPRFHLSQVSGFRAAGEWLKHEWGSPRQLRGEVLLDKRVAIQEGKRGHYLSIASGCRAHPFIREMALNSPIPEIAARLMRSERAYFCNDQLLVKPPGTLERTAWHQDQAYTLIQGEQVCAVRVPANKETSDMGPVEYLRGSHKSGKIYKVNYFVSDVASADDDGEDTPKIEGHEGDYDIVSYTAEPGDVVVHHLRTLHGAGGNGSATAGRGAVTLRYGGDDATYEFRKYAPPQEPSR